MLDEPGSVSNGVVADGGRRGAHARAARTECKEKEREIRVHHDASMVIAG
jgi:hypothetical protein